MPTVYWLGTHIVALIILYVVGRLIYKIVISADRD